MTDFLDNLKLETFKTAPFPKEDVFIDSLFYPAAGNDGSPIRHWGLGVRSFVYADIQTTQEQHLATLAQCPFVGYKTWATRPVNANELTPSGWQLQIPPNVDPEPYMNAMGNAQATHNNSFAQWTIFERLENFGDEHGPKRFSFFFIRGEGAATYQALYVSNKALPKIVAIIRPGNGYGGGFTGFERLLLSTMEMHPKGLPEKLLCWYMISNPTLTTLDSPWATIYDLTNFDQTWPKDGEPDFRLALFSRALTGSKETLHNSP